MNTKHDFLLKWAMCFSEKHKQRQQQVECKAEITSASFQPKSISRGKEVAERVVDKTGKLYCALKKESQEGRKKTKGPTWRFQSHDFGGLGTPRRPPGAILEAGAQKQLKR